MLVLFTLRSDFVTNCASYPNLNALVNQHFIQVGAMTPDELVSAIARPALQVGLRLDPALISQIVNDVRGDEFDHGYFVAPTVFDNVTPDMRIAQEEIFGPVVGLIEAKDLDDAIALANHTQFGLSASVVTRDLNLALRFMREIEAGIIHVNSMTAGAEPHVPFGGTKASSSGLHEQGKAARDFFTEWKTVYVDPL